VKPKFCLIPLFVDSGECYDPGAAMKKKGGVNDAALSQALAEPELPQKRINWDLPSQSFRMECPGPAGLFVQLSPDRRRFELDGSPFFFTGCNSYYLMTTAADPGLQQQVPRLQALLSSEPGLSTTGLSGMHCSLHQVSGRPLCWLWRQWKIVTQRCG